MQDFFPQIQVLFLKLRFAFDVRFFPIFLHTSKPVQSTKSPFLRLLSNLVLRICLLFPFPFADDFFLTLQEVSLSIRLLIYIFLLLLVDFFRHLFSKVQVLFQDYLFEVVEVVLCLQVQVLIFL